MTFMEFIKPELLIMIPVLYLVGMGLKKSKINNTLIPFCLGILSIFLCAAWVMSTSQLHTFKEAALAVFTSITQGVLTAGASVYINQLYVQSKKKNNK